MNEIRLELNLESEIRLDLILYWDIFPCCSLSTLVASLGSAQDPLVAPLARIRASGSWGTMPRHHYYVPGSEPQSGYVSMLARWARVPLGMPQDAHRRVGSWESSHLAIFDAGGRPNHGHLLPFMASNMANERRSGRPGGNADPHRIPRVVLCRPTARVARGGHKGP